MSRPRLDEWQGKLAAGDSLTHAEVEKLLSDWHDDLEDAIERNQTTVDELEDARLELAQGPEYGNCKRGCAPAYLDTNGFCSPNCVLGYPRHLGEAA